MANFCCSIELEPRTLKQQQLDQAREIAVGIIQMNQPNEASNVFVEELELGVGAMKETAVMVVPAAAGTSKPEKAKEEEEDYSSSKSMSMSKVDDVVQCQCALNLNSPTPTTTTTTMDSPLLLLHSKFKEPLSAPF
ncbi:hypothetical protein M9H77_37256 [Catharanthus roseus]|uniref:Uncharacterized protein n=1 Tax=Catharanthus roseus TaxID=4058 RepID=A0ACB9ZWS3_CATRO|nr:hypothetical protein M9H77_37256 [Catharanthus roseus]